MRTLFGLVLASLGLFGSACGGVTADAGHRVPLDGTGGTAGVDGGGGVTRRSPATGGAVYGSTGGVTAAVRVQATGGVTTGGAGAGAGGASTFVVDGSTDAFGGPCASQYPGVDFVNPVGSATCPEVGSLAFWVYGDTIPLPCDRITGPAVASPLSVGWHCAYKVDETACNNSYVGDWSIDLPYFGPGGAKAPIPTTLVVDLGAFCAGSLRPRSASPDAGPGAAEQANLTTGVWLRCSGSDSFTGDGLAFYADGSFQSVRRGTDGRVEPVDGCDSVGLWGYIVDYSRQMNLYRARGTTLVQPTFSDGPRRHMTYATMLGATIDLALLE